MNIVLCTSPHIKHSAVLESDFMPRADLMYTFAPLGLLTLASVLRDKVGITPLLFDTNSNINGHMLSGSDNFYAQVAASIVAVNPDLVGFMTECDSYHHVLQICREIKNISPLCYVVLGGPHATAVAESTLRKWTCIDCIVLGEGEITFAELVQARLSAKPELVPGSIVQGPGGEPIKGTERKLIASLDELPFPAYDLYKSVAGEELFLEAGRGCPFNCTFCSTAPFWERKSRVKTPQRIVEEIKHLRKYHQVERVHFTHDLFTANKKWVEDVCNALISSGTDVKWTCSSRIDTVTEDLLALMSRAGCNSIFFGVESGSERILSEIKKPIPPAQTLHILKKCIKHNINPVAGLIVGFPFEDEKSFTDTFNTYYDLLRIGTKPVHIFSYCPFAQSSLHAGLNDLECSGNHLDLPLSPLLDSNNRSLISGDRELFGAYFRPVNKKLPQLKSGQIYAVDEFALLVDCLLLPSMLLSENIGGMEILFYMWLEYLGKSIAHKSHEDHRKYFGSPVNFCDFLLCTLNTCTSKDLRFLEALLAVNRKNLVISSEAYQMQQPFSMANYKSKTLYVNLGTLDLTVNTTNIIDAIQVEYDVTGLISMTLMPPEYRPVEQNTNYVWLQNHERNVSLLSVSDFIYYVIKKSGQCTATINELISDWIQTPGLESEDLDFMNLIEDIENARESNLITLKN